MNSNGAIKISPKFTKEDFIQLELDINSESEKWNKAIEIIVDRISGRFFEPIDYLLNEPEKNAFAIMALNCLLVDTFYQFENGIDQARNNKKSYTKFLKKHFNYRTNEAEEFYKRIRCGILHSGQTKGNSVLTSNECSVKGITVNNDRLIVNIKVFTDKLKDYFVSYNQDLRNQENTKLRESFIKKMNFICEREDVND